MKHHLTIKNRKHDCKTEAKREVVIYKIAIFDAQYVSKISLSKTFKK